MTCDEIRALLPALLLGAPDTDAEAHLASCAACRASLDALRTPKGSFAQLAARLESEPDDCDDERVTMIAYGEAPPDDHVAHCARCRDRIDALRAVIARLDRLSTIPIRAFTPPVAVPGCDDEAVTAAAYGDPAPHLAGCARCRDRAEQTRAFLPVLDRLAEIPSRAEFAGIRAKLARRPVPVWAVAAAAAVLVALLAPLFIPPSTPVPPAADPLAWIDPLSPGSVRLDQLPALEAAAAGDTPRAMTAIRLLRDLGPAGEAALLAVLKRRPPATPAVAAALGDLKSREAVEELMALATPDALRALVRIGAPEAAPAFLDALGDPATAAIAMEGLGALPERSLVSWLELYKNGASPEEGAILASSQRPFIRETARWIAWRSTDHRQAVIAWASRDPAGTTFLVEVALDPTLGSDALDALAKLPVDRVTRVVEHALRRPELALAAAHVAAQLKLPLAHELDRAARAFPESAPDLYRAVAAVDALRVLDAAVGGSDAAAEALAAVPADALARAAAARRTAGAARVLAPLRQSSLFDYFVLMLPRASREAVRGLALLGDPRAVPHLIPLLSNPRSSAEALDALRSITGLDFTTRAEWERWWARNGRRL